MTSATGGRTQRILRQKPLLPFAGKTLLSAKRPPSHPPSEELPMLKRLVEANAFSSPHSRREKGGEEPDPALKRKKKEKEDGPAEPLFNQKKGHTRVEKRLFDLLRQARKGFRLQGRRGGGGGLHFSGIS